MISGLHVLIYTKQVDRVRAFLSEILEWKSVDAGNGHMMFAGPPTEVAVHESGDEPGHELWLQCDDINAAIAKLEEHAIPTTPVADRDWGLVTSVTMPGGDTIGMYEPRHASPFKK